MKIYVKAKAGAKEKRVEAIDGGTMPLWRASTDSINLKVWVKEPPVDGRANIAIAEALAKHFKISINQIRLTSGFSSKNKIFEIPNL